jgi:hypothetical protein
MVTASSLRSSEAGAWWFTARTLRVLGNARETCPQLVYAQEIVTAFISGVNAVGHNDARQSSVRRVIRTVDDRSFIMARLQKPEPSVLCRTLTAASAGACCPRAS